MLDWKQRNITRHCLRKSHFINQRGVCAYCGDTMNNSKNRNNKSVTLEHILPRFWGGLDNELYTIAVCHDCNFERGSMPLQWHMIVGIFLFKGFDAVVPICENLSKYYTCMIAAKTNNLKLILGTVFG